MFHIRVLILLIGVLTSHVSTLLHALELNSPLLKSQPLSFVLLFCGRLSDFGEFDIHTLSA